MLKYIYTFVLDIYKWYICVCVCVKKLIFFMYMIYYIYIICKFNSIPNIHICVCSLPSYILIVVVLQFIGLLPVWIITFPSIKSVSNDFITRTSNIRSGSEVQQTHNTHLNMLRCFKVWHWRFISYMVLVFMFDAVPHIQRLTRLRDIHVQTAEV